MMCLLSFSLSFCLSLILSFFPHFLSLPPMLTCVCSLALQLDGRLDGRAEASGDSRERLLEFGFDYCYWSVIPEAPNYASQEEVFQDLGVSVLAGAAEGYNICLFAYGQTGSGKTYTMMGTPDSIGLTPRICQGLFQSDLDSPDGQNCRVEISFLEIYNERVRDLLRGNDQKKPVPLRVREHPEKGPYVQGLSHHVVSDYKQAEHLLEEGISNRITAATHVHDASSRSHAIFSIQYTQAILENNLPSEIVSKINLVDLAGSERADPHYCRDRITEGANINKSLVTLGIVISALAQNSQMCSSSQSINSMLSEGEGSTVGSQSSSLSSSGRRHCFIPYRDSVLTWLLKDSLGGNSKTIMIATISPSYSSYNETLSTLRYAAHARNIVNKPRVNEDANVRLIRELREEIDRLKSMLLSFSLQRNPSPSLSDEREGSFSDIVLQNELKVEQLTKDWSESWQHKQSLLEEYSVDINQDRAGVQIHSLLPHLIALESDVLSTGVTIYHLREGITRIGPRDQNEKDPHIGGSVCEIENQNGVVTLRPLPNSVCTVNDRDITEPCRLAQGAVITIGGLNKFRALGAGSQELSDGPAPRQRLEEQQRYVECLCEKIQVEQRRAEKDLEREQAHLLQQHTEIQQWILQEKQRLAAIRKKGTLESGVQTDLVPLTVLAVGKQKPQEGDDAEAVSPSLIVGLGKQVVQEELLKHHALRRTENRIRRKRLHYQLERIARKRHLLEAKRELQRLEKTLPFGVDGPSSSESGFHTKCRGHPLVLRRHSFSADLLSRLYPQQTPIFRSHLQYQDEDVASLAPSECNTDILVSINPLIENSTLKEDQWIPEDLPVHNKFTNWSGINQQSSAAVSRECNPIMDKSPTNHQPFSPGFRHKPELLEGADRKTKEIERLRKEREQVLASVHLDLNSQQLSVELTEAKLHYGLGETDTLLKMLRSSPREEPAISAKQQLYDRHRRSIDGLKKEREVHLQNCRRARSLSPSKHPNSSSHMIDSQRPSDLPSRRREFLQQLRQEVVQMSRVPDPPRREGQCPSDIELLLRDYSRAREEARTEIARARERLRERTEQEKRRLQQRALAQAVKDDLRIHTRISNSTLCTGSNLSLSSGPTSGYNSSNAALLKDNTSPSIQITGVSEVGLRVRTRPPMIPPQAPRAWLSAQDVRLENSSSGYELQSSSSPSSPPARQRTLSFGSPSSLSTSYQDIADSALASALSEVHLASGGDLRNLLAGQAAAGWRHQGMERGVQTFHRPSSKPSAHGFLGAVELERSLASVWCLIRDHSKIHLYNESLKSAWTRPLGDSTQLVYLLTDPSNCELKQPRDFCCLSTESKQDNMWVLAMQSVFEESLPRPSVDTIRGEMLPSAWILQPAQRQGRDVIIVIYLL
ncbi:hypothetical protein NFI96_029067, partial [Prochilodus magdalenae]